MQDKSFADIANFLKNFETSESFNKYCFSMSEKQIQNMTTEDWISFLYGLNHLGKRTKCKTADELINKHEGAIAYMYSNFRLEKKHARSIKQLAYKMADALATSESFAEFYYNVDVIASAVPDSVHKDNIKTMRTVLYDQSMGKGLAHSLLAPKIQTTSSDATSVGQGYFEAGYFTQSGLLERKVNINTNMVNMCNTTAHELYHSIQRLSDSKRAQLMKKLGFKINSDSKINELYSLNSRFYLNGTKDMRGYKKQPLEYGARFFATCFERRLRHNLRAAENNWGVTYMSSQLLRSLNVFENGIQSDENGIILVYKDLDERKISLLQEFSQNYLKNNSPSFLGTMDSSLLIIEPTPDNIININRLYTQMKKAEKMKDGKLQLLEKYFPLTYQKFHASENKKQATKPVLIKAMINRLHHDK